MTTLAAIKRKAAEKLAITTVGQAISSQVDSQMGAAYEETYYELDELDLVTWAVDADIPTKVADYVADIMAWKRADVYATPDIYARCQQRYSIAERNIKRVISEKYQSTDENEDF